MISEAVVPPNASRGMAEGPPSFLLPPECGLLLLLHLLLTLGQRCGELGVGCTKGSIEASLISPLAVVLHMGAHVVAHGCGELSERYAGQGSSVGVAMPQAVWGEPRVGLHQRSPIGMAIEVLPEGVPAGFEVLSVQDPDGQLDQPAAELSQSLTFLAPAPTFQPNRERLVCDDTDVRLISRHSSAPFV